MTSAFHSVTRSAFDYGKQYTAWATCFVMFARNGSVCLVLSLRPWTKHWLVASQLTGWPKGEVHRSAGAASYGEPINVSYFLRPSFPNVCLSACTYGRVAVCDVLDTSTTRKLPQPMGSYFLIRLKCLGYFVNIKWYKSSCSESWIWLR